MKPPLNRLTLPVLCLVPLFIGCEERVVGVKNRYIGGQQLRADPPKPESDGPLEATGKAIGGVVSGTGDLLFGWTKPQPTVNVNNTYNQPGAPPTQPAPQDKPRGLTLPQ